MMPNAEPIELLTTGLALMALFASLGLCWRALLAARLAEAEERCDAVRTLAWGRVENEIIRGVVVLLVLAAGVSQVTTPMPLVPSPLRWWFQTEWAIIALLNLVQSLRNERRVKRLIEIIERERSAGRMP